MPTGTQTSHTDQKEKWGSFLRSEIRIQVWSRKASVMLIRVRMPAVMPLPAAKKRGKHDMDQNSLFKSKRKRLPNYRSEAFASERKKRIGILRTRNKLLPRLFLVPANAQNSNIWDLLVDKVITIATHCLCISTLIPKIRKKYRLQSPFVLTIAHGCRWDPCWELWSSPGGVWQKRNDARDRKFFDLAVEHCPHLWCVLRRGQEWKPRHPRYPRLLLQDLETPLVHRRGSSLREKKAQSLEPSSKDFWESVDGDWSETFEDGGDMATKSVDAADVIPCRQWFFAQRLWALFFLNCEWKTKIGKESTKEEKNRSAWRSTHATSWSIFSKRFPGTCSMNQDRQRTGNTRRLVRLLRLNGWISLR